MPDIKDNPKNSGRKQLFKNQLLESLTKTYAGIPIAMYSIVGIAMFYHGISTGLLTIGIAAPVFLMGLLSFTWLEYNVHRYIFHMLPNTPIKKNIQYKFHGVHHEYPKDKLRLAMPPVVSILLAASFYFLFELMMGNYVFAFLPGFLLGYSYYLGIHYVVHAVRPPSNFLKVLWVHHGIHHYKSNDKAFGVTSPLWDYIYRTMP